VYDWQTGVPGLDPLLMETDGAGAAVVRYTHGQSLISQRRGNVSHWYHFEALGTTRQLTDGTEAITDTYTFDAWGNEVASTGTTANPFPKI
jgi:hypothetical protein